MKRRFATHPSTWVVPFVVILTLAVVLPAIYLSATIDPQDHLDDFPIAVVVDPQTAQVPNSPAAALGGAVESAVDHHRFDVRVLSAPEAQAQMDDGKLYGAVRIPADFDASIASLVRPDGAGSSSSELSLPVVELVTNPRIGGITTSLFTGNLTPVLTGVEKAIGAQLLRSSAGGAATTPAQRALLAEPFHVATTAYHPLPAGTGLGTSAFYYSLLLVLLGFLGASSINPLVDSAMGFAPNELGPLVSRKPYLKLSRRSTLLAKFAVITAAAPVAAALLMLMAGPVLGMPIDHPFVLWLFSAATLAAVGLSALTVFAIFGGIGALVNMLFFVALAMTSSGGTVPLEATPRFFRGIAEFEPMHAIVKGIKSILYFDASPGSGLTDAWLRAAIGGAVGVLLGLALTTRFDRSPTLARHPRPDASDVPINGPGHSADEPSSDPSVADAGTHDSRDRDAVAPAR